MISKETHGETTGGGTASVCGRYRVRPYGAEGTVSRESNAAPLRVVHVSVTKTVSPPCVRWGQWASHTIVVCNESDIPIRQIELFDRETAKGFLISKLRCNGTALPPGDLETGLSIGVLPPGGRAVVTFDARARSPVPAAQASTADVRYCYQGEAGEQTGIACSNPAEVLILHPDIHVWKTADQTVLPPEGRPVEYRLFVKNTGNVPLFEVAVLDRLPTGMAYVPGTTRIDGGPPGEKHPGQGILLGTLEAGQTVEIHYLARKQQTGK